MQRSLSLSVNSKHSQKSAFFAVTEFFADSFRKFNKIINHSPMTSSFGSSFSTSDASPFVKNDGNKELSTNILKHTLNVILGFIPRIHTKHTSTVILGLVPRIHMKHSPLLDTRVRLFVTPENDYNNIRPQCAPDTTGFLSDVYKRSARAQKTRALETAESGVDKVVSSCEKNPNVHKTYMNFLRQRKTALDAPLHAISSGRSMIEMLGVLAIIGVLSVGGIAGYSKAMEKFKFNRVTSDFNTLIMSMVEFKDSFEKIETKSADDRLGNVLYSINLLPKDWKKFNYKYFKDSMGNIIEIYNRQENKKENFYNGLVFDYYLGDITVDKNGTITSNKFNTKLCLELFKNTIIPMHNVLKRGRIYPNESYIYYGDAYCDGKTKPCLKDLTLSRVAEMCNSCNTQKRCNITITF